MRSRRRSVLLGDLMPLEEPLTDTTLRLTDGGAFAMFGLDGLSAETADVEELNVRHARVEHTLRNIRRFFGVTPSIQELCALWAKTEPAARSGAGDKARGLSRSAA